VPAVPPACLQDALHGDIGIISQQDLLVCFSKSGATEEIIRLVPFAKVGAAALCADAGVTQRWVPLCCARTLSFASCALHHKLDGPACIPLL